MTSANEVLAGVVARIEAMAAAEAKKIELWQDEMEHLDPRTLLDDYLIQLVLKLTVAQARRGALLELCNVLKEPGAV